MYRGIFFSHDPGGTNALIPVVRKLNGDPVVKTFNFASGFAVPIWKAADLEFTEIGRLNEQSADELLAQVKPDFVFTGTSEDPTHEFPLWRAAQTRAIPTFSIIDHWTRYKERYVVNDLFIPTDGIFVIDDLSQAEMIRLGFGEGRVFACGQPHFEQYQQYNSTVSQQAFCASMNLPSRPILLFVSDILSKSFPAEPGGALPLGYDEHTTLNDLLCALEGSQISQNIQLVVKLHPKESEENFTRLLAKKQLSFPITILKKVNNLELIFHSQAVVGMFSMMLFEAYLMRRPVLSVQLNATTITSYGRNDIPVITRPHELAKALEELVFHSVDRPERSIVAATDCIIKVIKEKLNRSNH